VTISTEAIVAGPYTGTGLVSVYAFAFKVYVDTDVLVKHTDEDGVDTTAVLNTDYTVTRNADQDANPGGTITWKISGVTAALPDGEKVTITSQVPYTQGVALPSGGSYAAKTIERSMVDKCVILIKQLLRSVVRSIRQPITDTTLLNELPAAADRASKYLAFDSFGQLLVSATAATVPAESQGVIRLDQMGITITNDTSTPSTGVQNANSTIFNTAIRTLIARGGGKIIVPDGFIHLNDVHEISTFVQASSSPSLGYWSRVIQIEGEGRAILVQNHTTKPLIRLAPDGGFRLRMKDVTLYGRGSVTKGNLLELMNAPIMWTLNGVVFKGTGGIGLFIMGSERGKVDNCKFFECRQAIVGTAGVANNEIYYENYLIMGCGYTVDPLDGVSNKKSYSVNVAGDGFSIKTTGNYFSEHHHAVQIDNAANSYFKGGSVKTTEHCAGMRFRGVRTVGVESTYFEGFGLGANPSLTFYGQSEATTLSAGIDADDLIAPVDSTLWFGCESSDSRFDSSFATATFVIYDPADVNTFELVTLRCFRDGNAILTARGVAGGVAAQSWASGVVIREYFGNAGNGKNADAFVKNCHLESYQTVPGTCVHQVSAEFGYTAGEVIVGIQYDAFHNATSRMQGSANVSFEQNQLGSFSPTNGGKIQTWNAATVYTVDHWTELDKVVGAQSNPAAAFSTDWTFQGPDRSYTTQTGNNVAGGTRLERLESDGIQLGGNGRTFRILGERGTGMGVEADKSTVYAGIDNLNTEAGWKIWDNATATWIANTVLERKYLRIGPTLIRQGMSVSADNGDAAKTLTPWVDRTSTNCEPTQRWATALTADRAVTLSTTGALVGMKWRVVRQASATGAFNLNVGTGPLKALAVGQWCDVEYTGSAWILTAFGSL